ncbi:MAG TPA: EamA family transporter [Thermoanaerobaculia bacterium]|jgi:drug/metabolite transporter (DMT)-like permease|nr:EamA family transporter [Thermoanaerobaculia bacterium]
MSYPRLAAIIAIVFWGISFVATKAVLREISPVTLIFCRFAIGALVLLALVRELPPRSAWPSLALMGFIGIFVHQMLQAYGLMLTAATNAGWLIGLTPLWSAVLSAIVLRERFSFWKVVGLAGGFAGALLVVTRGEFSAHVFSRPSTIGDLLIFISTINWAIYSVVGHATIRKLGPRRATSGAMLFGTLMLTPFFIAQRGWREVPQLSSTAWGALLFLAIGCSALGYLFWYGALEQIEVSRVAIFLYLEPLITFIAAAMLLGERVSGIVIAGGLLVLVSVLIAQYAPEMARTSVSTEES